jgi:glycosyltransferase involved in cell wall biosynthesis
MRNNKLPISAVMVLYNNERVLERAIKSFYDLVDELIIVHDGKCSDRSLEIARKYTDKIYIRPHIGEAEPHRVFTYEKAKNEWILQVDADEYLSKELRNNLPKLIKSNIDIYEVLWPIMHKGKVLTGSYKTVLFKKSKVYYLGVVHEYPKPIEKEVKVKTINFPIIHDPGYENSSIPIFRTKWMKLAKLQAKQYASDFKLIPKWNYNRNGWDYPTNLRLKHPVMYGMILSPAFHLAKAFRSVFKYKSLYPIKEEIYVALYFLFVFYYFKFTKNK